MKRQSKKIILIILMFSLLMAAGCARSVTPLFPLGKTVSFEINFSDNIDASANRYYIVLNSSAAPQIPFTPIEFIEPDDTPAQPEIDYFNTYYPTWDDYFVLEGNNIFLVSGPFITSEAVTREVFATWSGAEPKKIMIDIDISRLNLSSNLLYFDFVTVDHADKMTKDNLSPSNLSVTTQFIDTNYSGINVSGVDESGGVSGALDILNWSVTIQ